MSSEDNSIKEELQKLHETMKVMNSRLENISDQNRPWISMTDNEKKYKLENNLLTLYLKNFGNGPAVNMKLKGLTSSKEDIDEEVISKRPSTDPFSIAPGEPLSYGIEASQDKIIAAAEDNSLYFGIEAEYEFNDKVGKLVLIGHIHITSNVGLIYSKKIIS